MLPIFGSNKVLCDGLSRRDLLHIGGLGTFGLALADLFRLQELQAAPREPSLGFGKAKACILLFLFGSPPQHEGFDPKPGAPAEIQGELTAIRTSVPGVHIGEGLPRIAKVIDRVTLVRSLRHPYPLHGVPYALTGEPTVVATDETKRDATRWPFIGSVVDYVEDRRAGGRAARIPRNIALPFPLYAKVNYPLLAGPYGGFLGARYDPVWTSFEEKGTHFVPHNEGATGDSPKYYDPFGGIRPGARIGLGGIEELPDGGVGDQFELRRSLLQQFDGARRWVDADERVRAYSAQQGKAWSLLTSNKVRQALDVQREPPALRERYGMTLFGQAALAARRLVEAGSKFVTVFWDAYGHFGNAWDTHTWHFARLKQYLLPGLDETYSALILDLEARGLLDETLVICISEHGRTPKLNKQKGGGRDHWSRAYSAVFAGGGVARGKVVGRTDAFAADVLDTPVSPKDVLATAFHLLGIDPHTTVTDRLNRPVPITGSGVVRHELFG
jgi:hypothetical protein